MDTSCCLGVIQKQWLRLLGRYVMDTPCPVSFSLWRAHLHAPRTSPQLEHLLPPTSARCACAALRLHVQVQRALIRESVHPLPWQLERRVPPIHSVCVAPWPSSLSACTQPTRCCICRRCSRREVSPSFQLLAIKGERMLVYTYTVEDGELAIVQTELERPR